MGNDQKFRVKDDSDIVHVVMSSLKCVRDKFKDQPPKIEELDGDQPGIYWRPPDSFYELGAKKKEQFSNSTAKLRFSSANYGGPPGLSVADFFSPHFSAFRQFFLRGDGEREGEYESERRLLEELSEINLIAPPLEKYEEQKRQESDIVSLGDHCHSSSKQSREDEYVLMSEYEEDIEVPSSSSVPQTKEGKAGLR